MATSIVQIAAENTGTKSGGELLEGKTRPRSMDVKITEIANKNTGPVRNS